MSDIVGPLGFYQMFILSSYQNDEIGGIFVWKLNYSMKKLVNNHTKPRGR